MRGTLEDYAAAVNRVSRSIVTRSKDLIYAGWIELKAALDGHDPHSILVEAERLPGSARHEFSGGDEVRARGPIWGRRGGASSSARSRVEHHGNVAADRPASRLEQ